MERYADGFTVMRFERGKRYIFYAKTSRGVYQIHVVSRSGNLSIEVWPPNYAVPIYAEPLNDVYDVSAALTFLSVLDPELSSRIQPATLHLHPIQ